MVEQLPHDEAAFFGLWAELRPVQILARFTVDGEPASKSRARFTKSGHAYTPAKTKEAEAKVAWSYKAAGGRMDDDPETSFGVFCIFFNGTRQRRDVDNMIKLILDGLNGVAWVDDAQVLEVAARKDYVPRDEARTEVVVYQAPKIGKPMRQCVECGKKFRTYDSWPNKVHCSNDCMLAQRRLARRRTCESCGTEWDSGSPNSKAKYCSKECVSTARRVEVACSGCGTKLSRQKCHVRAKNWCSPKCRSEHRAPLSREAGTCEHCGGPTSKKAYTRCATCRDKDRSRWDQIGSGDLTIAPPPEGRRAHGVVEP